MKKSIVVLFLVVVCALQAQVVHQFTHYSVDDGLSENNVLCILQDRKGFMWFGTYDGLNRYDGYSFRNFKGGLNHTPRLLNYRIDNIKEDKQGYLWLQTYDGRVYRFNPVNETFLPVPQCIEEYKNYKLPFNEIHLLDDGSVWLTNNKTGGEDCFRVSNQPDEISVERFSSNTGDLLSTKINRIFLDKKKNTWILSDKGIDLLKKSAEKPVHLMKENVNQGMNAIVEIGNRLYIGGEQGKLMVFDQDKGTFEQISTPAAGTIIDLRMINKRQLFVLSNRDVFYTYLIDSKSFRTYSLNNLSVNEIFGCYQDKHANLWIDTKFQGAIIFNPLSGLLRVLPTRAIDEYSPTFSPVFKVVEDKFDNLWVLTKSGGFFYYNRAADRLDPFYNDPSSKDRKFSNLIHTAMTDREGNLWLSTYSQGIDKVVFRHSQFSFMRPFDLPAYSIRNEVRSVFRDSRNRLWVGSRKGYVYLYDAQNHYKGMLGFDGRLDGRNPINVPVYTISEDHSGTIWLGSKGMGLFKVQPQPDGNFQILNYRYNADNIYSIGSDAIYSVFEDHLHRLWIATFGGGINLLDESTGATRFISNRNSLKNYPMEDCFRARYITEDKKGYLYVGTTGGLLVFRADKKAPDEIVFKRFSRTNEGVNSLSGNDVQYILPSAKGDLYLALFGGGLNIIKGGYSADKDPRFEVFEKNNGIFSNVIYTLKEDAKGFIWMSTQTKIIRFDPVSSKFDNYKPINSNSYFFVEAAACKTPAGDLIYGTSDGLVAFNPLKIKKSVFIPNICFTQLQIYNKEAVVGADDSPLQSILDDATELILTHKQNIFSIEYAALDYSNSSAIQYAYKLEGLDEDWNFVGNQRIATYTNLPKGHYVFHVKSTNSDGEWVDNERTIRITRLPSFWESAWGLLFYVLLFAIISIVATYILFIIYRLRNEVDVEQRISNMKLRFFTDISHELRTPLTLIVSPVDNLLKKENLPDHTREQLLVVKRNADRMLRLINQILDFRKIQNKKMKLIIEAIEVGDFMQDICTNFSELASEKSIHFNLNDKTQNGRLWVDKDKFEKIFFNLISNAFKFTNPGSLIELTIDEDTDAISITVKDQGEGIQKDKLKLLFNRFESIANSTISVQGGTGIGLSLTRELVELHQGSISVESEPGVGSSFTVRFLKGKAHYNDQYEFVMRDMDKSEVTNGISADDAANVDTMPVTRELTILIVEDNAELRSFLKSTLLEEYDVLEADSGVAAWRVIQTQLPDLIISDIMMPDMDGIELTRKIKSDVNSSHIPLILLTAKTDTDSKLEAMNLGADDYITKPFSSSYLEARIANLLRQRQHLQEFFRTSLSTGVIALSKPEVTNFDDTFIRGTIQYLEMNYENSEMNIDDIAVSSGLSRSSFFKKLKSLTGMAPVDFLKEFRLQKAIQLIEAGETNISQIAYGVGMNDPRYFSKVFKQRFKLNPSEYINRKGQQ